MSISQIKDSWSGLLLALAAAVLTGCSSELLTVDELDLASVEAKLLVDANGNPISNMPAKGQTYYVNITTPGHWRLDTDNSILQPERIEGDGPQQVVVCAFENWGQERESGLTLTTDLDNDGEAETRQRHKVKQTYNQELATVSKIMSSNKGAGYSYIPNTNYCLGANMELFNLATLDSLQRHDGTFLLIMDDLYPGCKQEIITAESSEELQNKLAINASLGLDFSKVKVKVDGSYGRTESNDDKHVYGMSRLKASTFTREINYMNVVAIAEEKEEYRDLLYAPGFRKYLNKYISDVKSAKTSIKDKQQLQARLDTLSKYFVQVCGPCFINKSMMGCSLDYEMCIEKSALTDSLTVAGSLEIGLSFAVSNIDIKGKGSYERDSVTVKNHSTHKISIRGGDVTKVSIIATGVKLSDEQVLEWQTTIKPENCVMMDMNLVPIYAIIFDNDARDVLSEYINRLLQEEDEETDNKVRPL